MAVRVAKMNACRVATRPTSKRKIAMPAGMITTPSASIPSSTARPPVMNRMIRWPARMLANRRTESDEPHEVREELEDEDEALHPRVVDPGRDEARQIALQALRADALDVVGDEHEQRE